MFLKQPYLKEQLRLKDRQIKTLEDQKKNTSNSSEFYVKWQDKYYGKEHIQELVDYLSSQSSSNIRIYHPQSQKYYSREEDIQKIVNSLNELYIVATNNMNSMLENMDF